MFFWIFWEAQHPSTTALALTRDKRVGMAAVNVPTNIPLQMINFIAKLNIKYILKPRISSIMKYTKIAYYLSVEHDNFIELNIMLSQI